MRPSGQLLAELLLFGTMILSSSCGSDTDGDSHDPAGTTVVDGRKLAYYRATGAGPTVVLESGLGDGYAPWRDVLAQLKPDQSVFAYDRAGYGGSEAADGSRDGARLVEELAHALDALAVPAPYLLVGHSLGGQLVQLFARTHPERVAGLLLVDGRPLGFTERCVAKLGEAECVLDAQVLALLPMAMQQEYKAGETTEAQLRAAPPMPAVPSAALSRTRGVESDAFQKLWAEAQRDQAEQLGAELEPVAGASHYIQRDAPAAVVAAIERLLARVESTR
ncbi:MAG TPA: alpha/beta hydrolase [Polyangiales bacterium]